MAKTHVKNNKIKLKMALALVKDVPLLKWVLCEETVWYYGTTVAVLQNAL